MFYKNFKTYNEYEYFLAAIKKECTFYLELQSELALLDTYKLWGFREITKVLEIECFRDRLADFSLNFKINAAGNDLQKILSNTFKKDLELFIIIFEPHVRFYNTTTLAPKFFNLPIKLFSDNPLFVFLKTLCYFCEYESRRQKLYLKLQIRVLNKNLTLAKHVLDSFDGLADKPEVFFLLKDAFDRLVCVRNTFNKVRFKKQEDYRIVYSTLRCIVVNYSDIVRLIVFRLELEKCKTI